MPSKLLPDVPQVTALNWESDFIAAQARLYQEQDKTTTLLLCVLALFTTNVATLLLAIMTHHRG